MLVAERNRDQQMPKSIRKSIERTVGALPPSSPAVFAYIGESLEIRVPARDLRRQVQLQYPKY
jgi:hypothetical protein